MRLLLSIVALGMIALGVALWVVTRSWFIIGRVQPLLSDRLGGEVRIADAIYRGGSRFEFEGIELRSRTLAGDGGEIFKVGRASVKIDLRRLLIGQVHLTEVQVDEALLRISEDARNSGTMNFMTLKPVWPTGSGPVEAPPRVQITNAVVQFGVHEGAEFKPQGQRRVSGMVYPTADAPGWFTFDLREIDERTLGGDASGVEVRGMWNFATNEHWSTTTGVELNDRTLMMCPQIVRAVWESMDLQGRVSSVREGWHPDKPFSMSFSIEDVAMTLPIETGGLWARYLDGEVVPTTSRPRMHVNSGTITLSTDRVVLDKLTGTLASTDDTGTTVGVPYEISVTIAPLPAIDWNNKQEWIERALRTAPFEMSFRIDSFAIKRDDAGNMPALDLPVIVAKSLAKFRLTDWVLRSQVQVSRGPATIAHDGTIVEAPLITNGQAFIDNATGRYVKFPYLLENVKAYLQFDNEKVRIEYLDGTGSGKSTVHIVGTISPPDNDAKVELTIIGTNVPVDDRLREALDDKEREVFDAVFHQRSYESLLDAGLLSNPAPDELAVLSAELAALKTQRAHTGDTQELSDRIATLSARLDALGRVLQAGDFQPGGIVDLTINIFRPHGDKVKTTTTGTIAIQSGGILFQGFPYPVRIMGGTLDWKADRIDIGPSAKHAPDAGDGIEVLTLSGGRGTIGGSFDLSGSGSGRRFVPRLKVAVEDDAVGDRLYAAIPLTETERTAAPATPAWPGGNYSTAARLLRGVGLNGRLNYSGSIAGDEAGKIHCDIDVNLHNGTARPTMELARAIGAAGLLWPADFALEDVTGQLKVQREGVELVSFEGRQRDAHVTAHGTVDLTGNDADTSIDVRYENFELGPYVVNFAPARRMEKARELWNLYKPDGHIDANLTFRVRGGKPETSKVEVIPDDLSVLVDERRVRIQDAGGVMSLEGGHIAFNDLAVEMTCEDRNSDGRLVLGGGYDFASEGQPLHLHGEWTAGQLESPLIVEAMRLFGAADAVDEFRAYQPAGEFDAAFDINHAGSDATPTYFITTRPRSLTMEIRGTPVHADIESGQVSFRPGQIDLDQLSGHHAGGNFTISGQALTAGAINATLNLAYHGRLVSQQVQAFLPEEARAALASIEFTDGGPTAIENCVLKLKEIPVRDGPSSWESDFAGRVSTSDAAFVTGVRFTEVNGDFDLRAHHRPDEPTQLNLSAHATSLRTLGQDLTDARWTLELGENGTLVTVPEFRSIAGAGTVTAQARFGVGERKDWQANVELAGVPLSGFATKSESEPPSNEETEPGGAERPTPRGSTPSGEVFASISLQGVRDDISQRTGRGVIRVIHGRVASVPIALQLVQVTQLTAPIRGSLDYADVNWFLSGDRVVFERILFESTLFNNAVLQLIGEGEMQFSTTELNTRFRSRSGVALLRDIMGELSDQFYIIEVTGPLRDPKARLIPPPPKDEH